MSTQASSPPPPPNCPAGWETSYIGPYSGGLLYTTLSTQWAQILSMSMSMRPLTGPSVCRAQPPHPGRDQVAVLGGVLPNPGIWLMIENERWCCSGGDTRISHYYPHTAGAGPGLVSLTVSLFLPRVLTRKYEQGAEETEAAAAGLKLGRAVAGAEHNPGFLQPLYFTQRRPHSLLRPKMKEVFTSDVIFCLCL